VAEGAPLLREYAGKTCIEGSNPSDSAKCIHRSNAPSGAFGFRATGAGSHRGADPRRLDGQGLRLVGPGAAVIYLFQQRPLKLWLINGGYQVVTYTVMGGVLGVWR
jgi:hypothetical protein